MYIYDSIQLLIDVLSKEIRKNKKAYKRGDKMPW